MEVPETEKNREHVFSEGSFFKRGLGIKFVHVWGIYFSRGHKTRLKTGGSNCASCLGRNLLKLMWRLLTKTIRKNDSRRQWKCNF
jgi:hypothetical protein